MTSIMLEMAHNINTTNEAIALAVACMTAFKFGQIDRRCFSTVIDACEDCADDCNGHAEYLEAYTKVWKELF